ncbi:MAG: LrgB family protein [Paracoccus sp. (in: a-proteobacteria)]|uniref:LrgB family protein n=1 Tax=Paracoccus sp. TaxID=267 RepID=UPI0026E01909|nr:LrgB family protein [Paracoccus sp. (in: a-proteobacteria)]MDO5622876.1 LrgB family protein [Paracoccus sp. (in: a-proteobacteria)]
MDDAALIWSYLAQSPLLWLTATLAAYWVGDAAFRLGRGRSWINPVLIAMAILGTVLTLTGTSYATYFEGAQFVHFMLGPATVALGLPLYDNLSRVRKTLWPLIAGLLAGSLTAMVSVLVIARIFGMDAMLMASLTPKSTTSPVAIGIAQSLGGQPTLTAVLVIVTGIVGAILATPLLNLCRVYDRRARGLATGTAAHGIGTARAFQAGETQGIFAGLGMGLNAVVTAILAPLVLALFL